MKLFYIFFLVLFLSSYSGGNDNNTDVVDSNFFNVDNIQAVIKERARHEDTVYEKIHSYLTSIDLVEGINRRNNELLFTSIGIGGSKISLRCEAYSSLFEYLNTRLTNTRLTNINTDEFNKILDTNPYEELVNVKNNSFLMRDDFSMASSNIIFINNVELEFESQSSKKISEVSEVFSLSTSIQLRNDFGDLSFSCDQKETIVNDEASQEESYGYFGLSPKTKTRFTNKNDYIESYFTYMNDLGFKEVVFGSGDVVGIVLQIKLKNKL